MRINSPQSKLGFRVEWTFTFSHGRVNQSIKILPRIFKEGRDLFVFLKKYNIHEY